MTNETRKMMLAQLDELSALAREVYDNLINAHDRNYLETLDFYRAAEHVSSMWRIIEYAKAALDN